MSEQKKEEDNPNQINQMKDTSSNINTLNEMSSPFEKDDDIIEKDIEKEEMNFDSIDFNINPFNSKNSKSDDKNDESVDLVLEEKEDDIFNLKNLNLNPKFHTSNDLLKIDFFPEEDPKETDLDKNEEKINNLFSDKNNNYINNNLNNNIINEISSMNTNNNSRKSYNNSNNLKLDLEANSFIPKNRNMNDNLNNFFMEKGRTSWVCSFCHNFNYESKKYILFNI
jgi:hypothetical protein